MKPLMWKGNVRLDRAETPVELTIDALGVFVQIDGALPRDPRHRVDAEREVLRHVLARLVHVAEVAKACRYALARQPFLVGAVKVLREAWRNDGTEGESVHYVCNKAEEQAEWIGNLLRATLDGQDMLGAAAAVDLALIERLIVDEHLASKIGDRPRPLLSNVAALVAELGAAREELALLRGRATATQATAEPVVDDKVVVRNGVLVELSPGVTARPILTKAEGAPAGVYALRFAAGAVVDWHSHPNRETLHAVDPLFIETKTELVLLSALRMSFQERNALGPNVVQKADATVDIPAGLKHRVYAPAERTATGYSIAVPDWGA
jgi:hypothetical protein